MIGAPATHDQSTADPLPSRLERAFLSWDRRLLQLREELLQMSMERLGHALHIRITYQIAFLSRVILPIIDFSASGFGSDVMIIRVDQRLDPSPIDRILLERPWLARNLGQRRWPGRGRMRRKQVD